jgi:hypothetical protein
MKRLKRLLYVAAALLFLFEAWLWDTLYEGLSRLLILLHIGKLKSCIVRWIEPLPPSLCVLVFIIPALLILPLKVLGLWLMGTHRVVAGVTVFVCAKLVGLGSAAFLFETCREKLLSLRWFFKLYHMVLAIKAWAKKQIAPISRLARELKKRFKGERIKLLVFLRRLRRKIALNFRNK